MSGSSQVPPPWTPLLASSPLKLLTWVPEQLWSQSLLAGLCFHLYPPIILPTQQESSGNTNKRWQPGNHPYCPLSTSPPRSLASSLGPTQKAWKSGALFVGDALACKTAPGWLMLSLQVSAKIARFYSLPTSSEEVFSDLDFSLLEHFHIPIPAIIIFICRQVYCLFIYLPVPGL